jgi:hypothetical protein
MSLEEIWAATFFVWLVSMLYVGPSYFRRLRKLIDALATEESELYETLGRPTLSFLDSRIRSTVALLDYVLRGKYSTLKSQAIRSLAASVRLRLLFWVAPFVLLTVSFPMIQ